MAGQSSANNDELVIPAPADFHVHLRQGAMSELVTPHVAQGGISLAYVMPNTIPPISQTLDAVTYLSQLQKIAPQTQFLTTLYLSPQLNPDEIRKAAKAGVKGVKSYPRGVTTNSEGGIEDYEAYYPVFEAMQECDMVLNLHGEVPSDADKGICVLNAEAMFLSHLHKLHAAFPRLRIVLEHATTRAAVEAVKKCGETVGCTITAHHLALTVDDWAGRPLNFCKPVAKYPDDREALREVIREGHPRFFLGSDSAPHPLASKLPSAATHGVSDLCACAAGVYTSAVLVPLCATLLERFGALHSLEGYVSTHGRKFYGYPVPEGQNLRLRRVKADVEGTEQESAKKEGKNGWVPQIYVHPASENVADTDKGKLQVVPFMAGQRLDWEIVQ